MNRVQVTVLAAIWLSGCLLGLAHGQPIKLQAVPVEVTEESRFTRVILVEEDAKPFEVALDHEVHIVNKTISNGSFSTNIQGPAEFIRVAAITRLVDGRPAAGTRHEEYAFKPLKKGKVKVTITVINPAIANPVVKTYEFTVR